MPRVTMITTAASPERLLEAGKTYNLAPEVAQPFLEGGFAEAAKPSAKTTKIPAQPDPEDNEIEDIVEDEE